MDSYFELPCRFEKEIYSVSSNMISPAGSNVPSAPSRPVHFIPHQIQRQLPTQRAPSQATFVPATVNAHSNSMINQMNSAQPQVNYTVTPMQVPSVVHNIPSTSGQGTNTKAKTKSQEKGTFINCTCFYYFNIS